MESIVPQNKIENRIYTIRGLQVILDSHLAEFYEVKSIRLREQVKRNFSRFPEDFMFQLTENEVDYMVSQNAIPSKKHLGGFLPYVFTEQGVAAVSGILKSEKAITATPANLKNLFANAPLTTDVSPPMPSKPGAVPKANILIIKAPRIKLPLFIASNCMA